MIKKFLTVVANSYRWNVVQDPRQSSFGIFLYENGVPWLPFWTWKQKEVTPYRNMFWGEKLFTYFDHHVHHIKQMKNLKSWYKLISKSLLDRAGKTHNISQFYFNDGKQKQVFTYFTAIQAWEASANVLLDLVWGARSRPNVKCRRFITLLFHLVYFA